MKPVSIIFLFCFLSVAAFSQTNTQGTDFWMTFGRFVNPDPSHMNLQIRIVTTKTTTVKWTFTADTTLNFSTTIKADEVYTKNLSDSEKQLVYTYEHAPTSKSLHLQSDEPISVYALAQHFSSTDATNVLPVSNFGVDYYHISYTPSFSDGFTAIALEDSTYIYADTLLAGKNLKAGDVLGHYFGQGKDMTGTHITSNKPIAYFVANEGAVIPKGEGVTDFLIQQMMPIHTWGTRFLVPVSEQGITRIRVVASQDETVLTQIGGVVQSNPGKGSLTLKKGEFVELETTSSDYGCYISSNKPVGVASFLVGSSFATLNKMGDPALAWIPPVEQIAPSANIAPFIPKGNTKLKEHYALIITPTETRKKTTLSLGGARPVKLTEENWITSHMGYSYYSFLLTDSVNSYLFTNPHGLMVLGYGLGIDESYYYLAGSAALNLNAKFYMNDISYQDIDGQRICNTPSFHIRSAISYVLDTASAGYLTWLIDGIEQLQVRDQKEWDWDKNLTLGEHTVTMRIRDISKQTYEFSTTFILCDTSFLRTYKIPVNPQIKAGI